MAAAFADRDISLLSTYLYRSPTSLNGLFGQTSAGENFLSLNEYNVLVRTVVWLIRLTSKDAAPLSRDSHSLSDSPSLSAPLSQ